MFYKIKNSVCLFTFLFAISISATAAYADNTTYILTARQNNLLKNLDRIADMTANVNTTGFKVEKDVFTEYPKATSVKEKLSFPQIGKTVRDDSQGGMALTGKQLDIAIAGQGYFMVTTPYGPMFTRNGSLTVSKDGLLVNQDGYPITSPGGGQIELTEKDVDISIKEDGQVRSGDEERGQIGVFVFDNDELLERVGKGLFRTSQPTKVSENFRIAQGMLETSNVNSVTSMTSLVDVSRNIENIDKLASSHNDMQINMIRKMAQ